VLAETQCTLVIVPAPAPVPAPAKSSDDGTRALKLLEKGNEQLAQGLVASARQLYERATDMGLAQAAMALAATYDPAEFEGLELRGVQADAKEARRWYERAQALGASDAGLRLKRLEQR
jgi:TPR repeat protein